MKEIISVPEELTIPNVLPVVKEGMKYSELEGAMLSCGIEILSCNADKESIRLLESEEKEND